jgi:hypothetical protein
MGQYQESVSVGKPFSLLTSIVLAAIPASAELEPFDVPPEGQDVLLVMYAQGYGCLVINNKPCMCRPRGIPGLRGSSCAPTRRVP